MDGDGLKIIREGHGLTQAQMAKELGVSRQSYIAWERDKYKMPADKVKILLDGSDTLAAAKPKETEKQRIAREAIDADTIKRSVDCYRRMRAWPQGSNHLKAIAYLAREGTTIDPRAYAAIVAEFPDILTDPNGDHSLTKEQSFAALGISTTNRAKAHMKRGIPMALRTGTSHFVSLAKAAQYYRDYDNADGYATARAKLESGEIHIGKPELKADGSQRYVLLDNGTRYGIEDSN